VLAGEHQHRLCDIAIPRGGALGGVLDDLKQPVLDLMRLTAPPIKRVHGKHARVASGEPHEPEEALGAVTVALAVQVETGARLSLAMV